MLDKQGAKPSKIGNEDAKNLQVLILEDSRTDALLMERELQRRWQGIRCETVSSEAAYLSALHFQGWDLILSDYKMPDYNGLQALEQLQELDIDIPFVLVSGFLDEEVVLQAVNLGVRDYLRKDNLERLVPLVERIQLEKRYQWREARIRQYQSFLIELLELLNSSQNIEQVYQEIVEWIREFGMFRAVGIRLVESDHFHFKAMSGFQEMEKSKTPGSISQPDFVKEEIISDMIHECLKNRDSEETSGNSQYWLNDLADYKDFIMKFPDLNSDEKMWVLLNYQSVAILPFHQNGELSGLLQLVGVKKDKFDEDLVEFYLKVCNVIEIANNRSVMEQTLWEQGEMIRRVIEHSSNVIFLMTPDFHLSYISELVVKLFGYSVEELQTNWVDKLTTNPLNQAGLKKTRKSLKEGTYQGPFKLEFMSKSGETMLVEVNYTPMRENGRIVEIVGTLTDLSKLKRSEIAVLERDRQYTNLVSKAKVGVAIDDKAGNIVYLNDTFAELFGYQRNELSYIPFSKIIHEADREKMKYYHQMHIQGKGEEDRYELRGIRKDGTIIYNEVNVDIIRNNNGDFQGTRIYLWDITDRKRNEILLNTMYQIAQSIHKTENTAELFEEIRMLLSYVMDTTNIFIALYNPQTDELTIPLSADSEDEIECYPAGKTLSKYVIAQGKAALLYEADMDILTANGEIDLVGKPSKVWLGAPLVYKSEISGVIVVQSYDNPNLYTQRDLEVLEFVSDEIASALKRKQMDEKLQITLAELQESEKNLTREVEKKVNELREKDITLEQRSRQAAIGEMISRLGHNWRQPLNTIGSIVQSIGDANDFDDLTDELLEEKIGNCLQTVKELSSQIDKLRFIYRCDDVLEDFEVCDVMSEVIDSNQNRFKNNLIDLIYEQGDSYILYGARSEFHQAINYVLSNAFEILLERKVEKPWVKVKQQVCQGELLISISDNGGGVDEKLGEKIFELFISTKSKLNNTGLGLNLARLIIEQHLNGRLILVNKPEGAEFVFKLSKQTADSEKIEAN
ncbi:MAG: PAS domain S-box protein [Candidatus Cloacimonetes bacterium]|nr:PAS domain S-box protein [Candidatus Cloacimonadota bacterium]